MTIVSEAKLKTDEANQPNGMDNLENLSISNLPASQSHIQSDNNELIDAKEEKGKDYNEVHNARHKVNPQVHKPKANANQQNKKQHPQQPNPSQGGLFRKKMSKLHQNP